MISDVKGYAKGLACGASCHQQNGEHKRARGVSFAFFGASAEHTVLGKE